MGSHDIVRYIYATLTQVPEQADAANLQPSGSSSTALNLDFETQHMITIMDQCLAKLADAVDLAITHSGNQGCVTSLKNTKAKVATELAKVGVGTVLPPGWIQPNVPFKGNMPS